MRKHDLQALSRQNFGVNPLLMQLQKRIRFVLYWGPLAQAKMEAISPAHLLLNVLTVANAQGTSAQVAVLQCQITIWD